MHEIILLWTTVKTFSVIEESHSATFLPSSGITLK